MHIEKNKNKDGEIISFRVSIYGGIDASGKEIRHKKTFKLPKGMSASQADRYIRKTAYNYEDEFHTGHLQQSYTFQEYSYIVLEAKRLAGLKKTTLARYESMLERINDYIGSYQLTALKPFMLESFYKLLGSQGQNKKTNAGLSPKTIKEHHNLIASILEHAVNNDIIPKNIARNAAVPKVKRKESPHFEPEELQRILKCAEREPIKWHLLIKLLTILGGRRGEIVGLKWSAIDMDNKLFSLERNTLYLPGEGIFDDTLKTDASNRFIRFSDEIKDLLNEYKDWQDCDKKKKGDLYMDYGYVFTQFNGKAMHPDSINGYLNKFSKKYSLPHINPHKFRHTVCSILISEGIDIVTVSKLLGHSNPTTTSSIYAHAIAKKQAEASEVLCEILLSKNPKK